MGQIDNSMGEVELETGLSVQGSLWEVQMTFEEFERRIKANSPDIVLSPVFVEGYKKTIRLTMFEYKGDSINTVDIQVELALIEAVNRVLNFPEIIVERMQYALQSKTSVRVEIKNTDLKALMPIRLIGA